MKKLKNVLKISNKKSQHINSTVLQFFCAWFGTYLSCTQDNYGLVVFVLPKPRILAGFKLEKIKVISSQTQHFFKFQPKKILGFLPTRDYLGLEINTRLEDLAKLQTKVLYYWITYKTPKYKLSLNFQPVGFIRVEMAIINMMRVVITM